MASSFASDPFVPCGRFHNGETLLPPAPSRALQPRPPPHRPLAIALLSGGLDSATAAALAIEAGHRVIGISFDYGQRHRRELAAAATVAGALALE